MIKDKEMVNSIDKINKKLKIFKYTLLKPL